MRADKRGVAQFVVRQRRPASSANRGSRAASPSSEAVVSMKSMGNIYMGSIPGKIVRQAIICSLNVR